MKRYDLIVIGGGSAGFVAAYKAREASLSVALAEKHKLGGECPNYACLPSKALLRAAEIFHLTEQARDFGISVTGAKASWPMMMASKDMIVQKLTGSPRLERALERAGVAYLKGEASFIDEHTLRVDDENYSGEQFVIASGSDPFIPPISGLETAGFINSIEASMLDKQPRRIAIIGAGPVGCEYAQLFIRLHSDVFLIQRGPVILDREDWETQKAITESFNRQGIKILVNSEVVKAEKDNAGKTLTVQTKNGQEKLAVDEILVVPGRRADLANMHLEKARVKLDERGRLVLNDYLQTSQPHIWAAGDAAGRFLFTHVAAYEGDIVGWNLTHPGELKKPDYRVVPRATFTHPEVGSVGLTEQEAKQQNLDYLAASYPLGVMGRGLTVRETGGFIKIIVDKKSGQLLGAHMAGSQAGEVIHELALAIFAEIPVQKLATMIHAFPTMAEAVSFVTERLLSQTVKNVADKQYGN
ncbi:MAG: NAD(P)/FAD-dependent oxidoreductase [Candidatus Doudnabacteria bacterium]|nr:NAD(P)/FAD-dependent oxidoreductase [Candidatus Doudnabacteria bacterium]